MNVLKNPSFFRPTSRPSSPAPVPLSRSDSGLGGERVSRPLNKLSLGSFRRASPAPTPTSPSPPIPLVQDGSYLEMLSLKLSEAVSKALAQPTGPAPANEQVAGRRPIPAGRGHALGALIASWVAHSSYYPFSYLTLLSSELKATRDIPHLHRAILRSLHRPLSVLLTNLSAHLLPLLSSPAFHCPPAQSSQASNLNPIHLHALGIATFAGELLETFDDLALGTDGDVRGDGLKIIREGLVSLVGRVINPLVGAIKSELIPLIEALELPNCNNGTKAIAGVKTPVMQHTSIVALQGIMPIYARALSRYTTSPTSQTILATFLISLIWRGLVALSHRPDVSPSPPTSPDLLSVSVKKRRSPSSTPPLTPPMGRFTIKLPPSRPPSPLSVQIPSTAAGDARALYDLLNLLPRPAAHKETTRLAQEAVDEAFSGLKALPIFLEYVVRTVPGGHTLNIEEALDNELEVLTEELPTLIALPILLRVYGGTGAATVAEMLGLSEGEYRKACLAGFGRAEECTIAAGQQVLRVLCAGPAAIVSKWLEIEIAKAE